MSDTQHATRRRSSDRALAAQQEVARILADARSPEEALPRVAEAACRSIGWGVAAVWVQDEGARAMRCAGFFHSQDVAMDGFKTASLKLEIPPGSGLPGQVLASRDSVWIPDLTRSRNHPRAAGAARSRLRCGFAVPVRAGQQVYGALEFYANDERAADRDMLEMMSVLGSQIGHYIKQTRAERFLRESEQRYRLLFDGVTDAILIYDVRGRRIVDANASALSLYGMTKDELQKRRIDDLFAPEERAAATFAPSDPRGARRTLVAQQQRRDGTLFPAEMTLGAFSPGDELTGVVVVRDITERRRADESEKLRQSERLQREFVATVSHELRTPVAAIRGFAETLKNGGLEDKRNRTKFVAIIEKHSRRLQQLIEDILDLSALESKKRVPKPEPVLLSRFVRRLSRGLLPLLRGRKLSVRLSMPESLKAEADRAMLAQVVQNLLANAIKYSPRSGRIDVVAAADGERVRVTVSDQGPGIPPEDLPHIFERFSVLKKTHRRKAISGTGLGLSIVKQIVEAHGGSVWADPSVRGRGASFHFTLPRALRPRS